MLWVQLHRLQFTLHSALSVQYHTGSALRVVRLCAVNGLWLVYSV